ISPLLPPGLMVGDLLGQPAVRLLVRPLLRLRAREEYGARALADADQVNCAIGAHPGRDDPPPSWHGHQVLWAALIAYEADRAGGVASRGARSADAEYDDGDGDREDESHAFHGRASDPAIGGRTRNGSLI